MILITLLSNKINFKYNVRLSNDYDRIGLVTVKGEKEDKIYYCYLIEIDKPLDDDSFERISLYELNNVSFVDFDKFIIISSLIGDYFEKTF